MGSSDEEFGNYNELDYEDEFPMRKSLSMHNLISRDGLMGYTHDDIYSRRCNPHKQYLSKNKFVSTAEAIYHYQRDTPERYHTTRPSTFRPQRYTGRAGLTIPQSPVLRCKTRSRSQHILSQQEREELELEEIKKYKIKANPIPKSVLTSSQNLPEVVKKPITIPEPFKLTETNTKVIHSAEKCHKFKARPAPKQILEKPQIPVKPLPHITKPANPPINKKLEKSKKTMQYHGPVKPEPFSFEQRDEELKRRREERIRRQLEEQRKLCTQFKAQPLPPVVKKRMQAAASATASSSNASSENKENNYKFEAKPPLVLYKEPFKPILQSAHSIKPLPFDLTTQKRAAERERFDQLLKEKEEQKEKIRQEKEIEQLKAQEKDVAELRSKLVHHAKPVPLLDPFIPEKSSAPITVPETPKFIRRLKQN